MDRENCGTVGWPPKFFFTIFVQNPAFLMHFGSENMLLNGCLLWLSSVTFSKIDITVSGSEILPWPSLSKTAVRWPGWSDSPPATGFCKCKIAAADARYVPVIRLQLWRTGPVQWTVSWVDFWQDSDCVCCQEHGDRCIREEIHNHRDRDLNFGWDLNFWDGSWLSCLRPVSTEIRMSKCLRSLTDEFWSTEVMCTLQ